MSAQDFEELRRQFERQFGRKLPNFSLSPSKLAGVVAAAIVLVLLLVGAVSSYYTVHTDEVGVVLRLGKFSETVQPGLHFKIPFGIDNVTMVKVNRIHKEEFGFRTVAAGRRTEYSRQQFNNESIMLTADLGIADVEWIVQYRIKLPRDFLFNVKDVTKEVTRNRGSSTLRDVTENVLRLVVGDSSIDEVLTLRRREIAVESKRLIQEILDTYETGVEIVTVELQDVNPPEKVRASFNEVNRAIQEKQTTINEAKREWNTEIPAATGMASQMMQTAEGYKIKRVNEALGNVARFSLLLQEYSKAKTVTRTRLYLEALETVVPDISQLYIVDGAHESPLQILDLNKAGGAARNVRKDALRNSGSGREGSE